LAGCGKKGPTEYPKIDDLMLGKGLVTPENLVLTRQKDFFYRLVRFTRRPSMFEFLGLLYGLAKDLKEYLEWDEQEKLVSFDWVEKSGFGKEAEKNGVSLRWSKPEKIESRLLDEYEVMYEVEKLKRVRRKLVLKDGSVLIGRRG
jgi:hypothetical protein